MNVFHRFTRRSLAKNRTRTLVTVVGIVLSMALFTAVIEGAYSGVRYLIRSVIESVGSFHACFYDVTEAELNAAREDANIKDVVWWREVGWAEIGSKNESKPYLLIESVGPDFTDLVTVRITDSGMTLSHNRDPVFQGDPITYTVLYLTAGTGVGT